MSGPTITIEGALCDFCQRPVHINENGSFRKVTGYIKIRKDGGAHAVELAGPPQGFAHAHCIQAEKRKGANRAVQEKLL